MINSEAHSLAGWKLSVLLEAPFSGSDAMSDGSVGLLGPGPGPPFTLALLQGYLVTLGLWLSGCLLPGFVLERGLRWPGDPLLRLLTGACVALGALLLSAATGGVAGLAAWIGGMGLLFLFQVRRPGQESAPRATVVDGIRATGFLALTIGAAFAYIGFQLTDQSVAADGILRFQQTDSLQHLALLKLRSRFPDRVPYPLYQDFQWPYYFAFEDTAIAIHRLTGILPEQAAALVLRPLLVSGLFVCCGVAGWRAAGTRHALWILPLVFVGAGDLYSAVLAVAAGIRDGIFPWADAGWSPAYSFGGSLHWATAAGFGIVGHLFGFALVSLGLLGAAGGTPPARWGVVVGVGIAVALAFHTSSALFSAVSLGGTLICGFRRAPRQALTAAATLTLGLLYFGLRSSYIFRFDRAVAPLHLPAMAVQGPWTDVALAAPVVLALYALLHAAAPATWLAGVGLWRMARAREGFGLFWLYVGLMAGGCQAVVLLMRSGGSGESYPYMLSHLAVVLMGGVSGAWLWQRGSRRVVALVLGAALGSAASVHIWRQTQPPGRNPVARVDPGPLRDLRLLETRDLGPGRRVALLNEAVPPFLIPYVLDSIIVSLCTDYNQVYADRLAGPCGWQPRYGRLKQDFAGLFSARSLKATGDIMNRLTVDALILHRAWSPPWAGQLDPAARAGDWALFRREQFVRPAPYGIEALIMDTDGTWQLTWRVPEEADINAVRLLRRREQAVAGPEDTAAERIYDGRATAAQDRIPEQDVRFHYAAFALDPQGMWSRPSRTTAIRSSLQLFGANLLVLSSPDAGRRTVELRVVPNGGDNLEYRFVRYAGPDWFYATGWIPERSFVVDSPPGESTWVAQVREPRVDPERLVHTPHARVRLPGFPEREEGTREER